MTVKILLDRVAQPDCKNGYVLDGFPRTIPQAEVLDKALAEMGEAIDAVNVDVPDENIVKRMLGRRACVSCGATYHIEHIPPKKEGICDKCGEELILRDDDKPETVLNRLHVYHEQTQPLIDFYKEKGVLKTVDGTVDMKDVFAAIAAICGLKSPKTKEVISMAVTIKSAKEIELMRESCRLLADVFQNMEQAMRPGMSTLDVNILGEKLIRAHGCIPNFLHLYGYPASVCVSVNDEVVHGIPRKDHILQEGDIVSLDAGLIYKGYHSDMARTFGVGEISGDARLLIERTRQSFFDGIKMAKAGNHLYDISNAIDASIKTTDMEL